MENPWKNSDGKFFSEEEKKIIDDYNANCPYLLDTSLLSQPYCGNPDANIIILGANPGIRIDKKTGKRKEIDDHAKEQFILYSKRNLWHENKDYPFFYLHPDFRDTAGGEWINEKLKDIVTEFGPQHVSQRILFLELHPYHSMRYAPISDIPLPSQKYTMHLLKTAIENRGDNLVVIARSFNEWERTFKHFYPEPEKKLSELLKDRVLKLNSARNMSMSQNNLGDGFEKLVAAFK